MTFRDLAIGETFQFDHSELGPLAAGLASGPWRKVSARKYDHVSDPALRGVRVGSVRVQVVPEIGQRTGLAMALFTATQWHSDRTGGINLLSLGSTRKIHSEKHRAGCIAEITANLAYAETSEHPEMKAEPARLRYLLATVQAADVGAEWLTDADNLRINETLYRAGALA